MPCGALFRKRSDSDVRISMENINVAHTERSLVIIKPDAVQRGLIGEITARYEKRGLKIAAMKLETVSRETAERHYGEHKGKPFYEGLVGYITSAPSVLMVV